MREPLSVLEALKRQLGSDAFYAQYQQMPVPPGGAMIKRHWIQRYNELPPEQERLIILQSWDTANKGGPENDFSVCTTWVVTRNRRWYLIDVWRKRVDYPELKAAVQTLAAKYKAKLVLVEDAGAGTSLVQELRSGKVPGIVAVKPERDKVSRMSVVSAKFESGQVFLPERAPWLADFERELFAFPGAKHDDQCDSVSQAISEQNYRFPMIISKAVLARCEACEELDAGQHWPRHFDAVGVARDDMRASRLQFRNDHETRCLAHVVGLGVVGEPKDCNPFADDRAAAGSYGTSRR